MRRASQRQRAELVSILTIKDPRTETMLGIVRRMEALLKIFRARAEFAGLIPFCETYRLIARDIMLIPEKTPKRFGQVEKLDRLNVAFIAYYFQALRQFVATGKATRHWQAYFLYCQLPNGSPFLQMILGVNAHINGDFPHALLETRYANRKDFLLMNRLLEDEVPTVMRFLAFGEKDRLALGGVLFKKFARQQFHQIVIRWRLGAWRSATALKTKKMTSAQLATATEAIGRQLIEIFAHAPKFDRAIPDLKQVQGLRVSLVKPLRRA